MKSMERAIVHTGSVELHKRPVESVSVIEIPVENFVRKHELVLTTGIGCGNDSLLLQEFVQDIVDSEAAALGIATGRHVMEIPSEVVTLAERYHLPIIEIPWDIRFADVTEEVLSGLHQWHLSISKQSEQMQNSLLLLFLRGADLSQAAEIVKNQIGSPVVIIDRDGLVKGKSKDSENFLIKWESYAQSFFTNNFHAPAHLPNTELGWIDLEEGEDTILQMPIRSVSVVQGFILVPFSRDKSIDAFSLSSEKHLLEHAVTSAALWFQRESTIQETELRLRGDFVWSLAKGEIESWEEVQQRAKSLQYNVDLPYVCLLGYPENLHGLYGGNGEIQTSYEHWLQYQIRSFEDKVIQAGKAVQRFTLTTFQRDYIIIYLEILENEGTASTSIHSYLDKLERLFHEQLPNLIVSWGIGKNYTGVRCFHISFNDARIALDIGGRQKAPGHRSTYLNTSIYRVLQSLATLPEVKEITSSTIGILVDYDRQRGLDLIKTLMTYIQYKSNVSQTSRVLHLHRQSLLYRLRKIETLTGRSLLDPDDLFLLDLSVKLWTVGGCDLKIT